MLSPTRLAVNVRIGRCAFSALVALTLATTLLTACATTGSMRLARTAEQRQDYDLAVVEYTKAVHANPDDTSARLGLERSRIRAAQDHFQRGRRLAATGKLDQALVEYEVAGELNPASGDIDNALRTTRDELRSKAIVAREGKTELETLIQRARDLPPPGIDLPQGVRMPASLTFREASSQLVFQTIAQFGNVSVGFDPAFRAVPVTVDLRNTSLEDALGAVADQTRTFFRVTGPRTVLVIPDTPAKRGEYEEEVVQPFYLSNADLKEAMDLLRMTLDARRISPLTANNVLTLKDTPERVAAAARLLTAIDKARPEVIIDVELIEVDRTRLQEYGLQFASPESVGVNGSITFDENPITLRSLRNLSQSDVALANLPGLYYRLLKSDANSRILANPQLRVSEGSTAQARFGEKIPVPRTIFAPIATGGTAQQPITSFDYADIGVNIDISPRMHHDDDVTLTLKLQVQSVSGSGFGNLPTFGNREVNTVIRLRDGETNMLAGLIRDEERHLVEGIPGLSNIPAIGRIFAHSRVDTNQTDVVLTLTPHIIRGLDVSEEDLRAFRVGRDSLVPSSALPEPTDIPAPQEPTPQTPPATPPVPGTQLPGGTPLPGVGPINREF